MSTQHTIFKLKKKITQSYPESAAMGFFPMTQERVRKVPGKLDVSVGATEVPLHFPTGLNFQSSFRLKGELDGLFRRIWWSGLFPFVKTA